MNKFIILTGPTAVGKTDLSIALAKRFKCPIISADSRQIYKNMAIGTAQPSKEQLMEVEHRLIACKEITEYYSAYEFEKDTLEMLPAIFEQTGGYAFVTGGSMMYLDALMGLIDDIPTISDEVRENTWKEYNEYGLPHMQQLLKELDETYYGEVDLQNAKRVIHAVEICRQAGKPYSQLRTGKQKKRDFKIIPFCLQREREELYDRINKRVLDMVENGLVYEVRSLMDYRHLNSLNTVGYKEIFAYLDGNMTLEQAIEKLQRNTRVYAKKQITWFKKQQFYNFIDANDTNALEQIVSLILQA